MTFRHSVHLHIDYTDTQLADEELRELLELQQAHEQREQQKEAARRNRIYSFRFVGGM